MAIRRTPGGIVLRIHFTRDDLARTSIAMHPDPMWETLLSVYLLRGSRGEGVFGRWRYDTRRRLRPTMSPLLDLVPAAGSAPDFLTPAGQSPTLDEGIENLLRTPRARLGTDLAPIARERRLPAWTIDLAAGRSGVLQALGGAHRQYFHACLAPHWGQVQAHIERDVARRARTMAHAGVQAVLSTLASGVRWRSPTLEVDYPFEHDIHLAGRGLLLQSVFFDHGPNATTLIDESLRPVLVYSIHHEPDWIIAGPNAVNTHDPLAALLGRTRAHLLRTIIADAGSTTELARRTSTPLATVSRQASILRDAGLITSHRNHNIVTHTATPLGVLLGRGGTQPVFGHARTAL